MHVRKPLRGERMRRNQSGVEFPVRRDSNFGNLLPCVCEVFSLLDLFPACTGHSAQPRIMGFKQTGMAELSQNSDVRTSSGRKKILIPVGIGLVLLFSVLFALTSF